MNGFSTKLLQVGTADELRSFRLQQLSDGSTVADFALSSQRDLFLIETRPDPVRKANPPSPPSSGRVLFRDSSTCVVQLPPSAPAGGGAH